MIRNKKKNSTCIKSKKYTRTLVLFFFRPHKQQRKVGKWGSGMRSDSYGWMDTPTSLAPPAPTRHSPPEQTFLFFFLSSSPLVPPGCRHCAVWTIGSNNIQMYRCTVEMRTLSVITMRPTKKHGSKKSRGVLQVRQAASQMCIQTEGRAPSYPSLVI